MLSLQLGVMPIISMAGGLPEYQPPGCPPVGVDDVAGLAAAFDELADPVTATLRGAAAARHYAQRFAVDAATDRLLNVLTEVLAARSPAALPTAGRHDAGTVGIVSKRGLAGLATAVRAFSRPRRGNTI